MLEVQVADGRQGVEGISIARKAGGQAAGGGQPHTQAVCCTDESETSLLLLCSAQETGRLRWPRRREKEREVLVASPGLHVACACAMHLDA